MGVVAFGVWRRNSDSCPRSSTCTLVSACLFGETAASGSCDLGILEDEFGVPELVYSGRHPTNSRQWLCKLANQAGEAVDFEAGVFFLRDFN